MKSSLNIVALEEVMTGLVRLLVRHSDAIDISARRDGNEIAVSVLVHEQDLGVMIGKQGSLARSLRTLLGAISGKSGMRITLDLQSQSPEKTT